MALHDEQSYAMACGIAGLSVVVDSLSAINTPSKTYPRQCNIVVGFEIGRLPRFGNNDPRSTTCVGVVKMFMKNSNVTHLPRQAHLSILTITTAWYAAKTGSTPDGKAWRTLCSGASPCAGATAAAA